MSSLAVSPAYAALLSRFPPRIIHTEEQNESYIRALEELDSRSESCSPEERELAELFTLLIEDFEEKNYALARSTPADVVKLLMDQNDVSLTEAGKIAGNPDAIPGLFASTRELTSGEIRRLADRFAVSPEVFI